MKKIFLTLIMCSFAGAMFAQGAKFGVTAGLNVSNEVIKTGSISITPGWKAGFQAGIFMDYALTSNLSLIPELLFTQRGAKIDGTDFLGNEVKVTQTLNYLQLPVNLAYKLDLGSEQKLFPFAGIYLGYALSGNNKSDSESVKIKFGSEMDEMKAFDFGLNIGVGYQYTHFLFKVQYNHGLANIINMDNVTEKHKNVAVTVGYMF